MKAMDNNASARPAVLWIVIIAAVAVSVFLFMIFFWRQSKEFGEKAVNHAENMKNTTEKASALQKQINQQIKQQENLLKNLPE